MITPNALRRFLLLVGALILFPLVLTAQDSTPTPQIPDVVGLSLPQAAAALNRAGMRLGEVTFTSEGAGEPNTVLGQSSPAGEAAEAGTQVDVTVLQQFNTRLVWDDNDFTLINETGDTLRLDHLAFVSETARFEGRWQENVVGSGFCAQIWSVAQNGAKDVPGCPSARSTLWLTTSNRAEHFWTNGAAAFEVYQDGVYRGRCEVAALQCALYLAPSAVAADVTEYVYFVYTRDTLAIINRSQTSWMPTASLLLDEQPFSVTAVYPDGAIGNPALLAPGQCIDLWRPGLAEPNSPPEPCDYVAGVRVENVFWEDGFTLVSAFDGQTRACPPPVAGEFSVCLLPR